ncbi:MAG TPA: HAMP domain-containing protein [Gammaproteobacteria bacterium]|nr:HAMP domain-containing protein [Gammaproteobacteria bacterium]
MADMAKLTRKSLLLRMGIAMATITTFAFVSMVSSVIIAEMTQGVAAAVNQAGTLRMQSYRIANALAQEMAAGNEKQVYAATTDKMVREFESRLLDSRLVSILSRNPHNRLGAAYRNISEQWHGDIKPLFLAGQEPDAVPPSAATRARYLTMVDAFVADIDHMVKLLERDVESKISVLRLIQISSLFLTLIVVSLTMYLMNNKVLVPLRDLLACAQSARLGDFSIRTRHTGNDDELGQLGYAFNVMAEDLSKKYSDLEERVREKTSDLERSNRSLELLYNTTRRLYMAPVSDTAYTALLRDIEKLVGVGPGTICINDENSSDKAFKLATTRNPPAGEVDTCSPPNCPACYGEHNTHMMRFVRRRGDELQIISTPIRDQKQQYGVLLTEVPRGKKLDEWQTRLLEAVARHIGIAINITRQASENRRLALLEERGVIARELHDSLAQSLSYLKIQVVRLNVALSHPADDQPVGPIIDELREGISRAYRQLRELLTTFRLKIDGPGLNAALEETVEEFRERSGIMISLDNQLGIHQLSANEEIHVLHIIREALANVTRHSGAEHAQVTICYPEDGGRIAIRICDDGIGIDEEAERADHYGLAIMNERANGLGGEICVARRPEGGTEVKLEFTPSGMSEPGDSMRRTA